MLTGAMAKQQIEDRIRVAESERMARSVAEAGTRRRRAVRVVGSGLFAAVAALRPVASALPSVRAGRVRPA